MKVTLVLSVYLSLALSSWLRELWLLLDMETFCASECILDRYSIDLALLTSFLIRGAL